MTSARGRARPAIARLSTSAWQVPLAATLLLAACTETTDAPSEAVDRAPRLPRDVAALAERMTSCSHFAGEINGDHSPRDAEVSATITELRCDAIEDDAAATRRRYAGNAGVIAALDRTAAP